MIISYNTDWEKKKTHFLLYENWMVLICTNVNHQHPRKLCPMFGWNWPSRSGVKEFGISSTFFRYFVKIPHWKRAWTFIWTNLNFLFPRMLLAKFNWNLHSGYGEGDFQISSIYLRYFAIFSPWKIKNVALHLNKYDTPSRKALVQIGTDVRRRRWKYEKFTGKQGKRISF